MPEEEKKARQDGSAIYDALASIEGPIEREQPAYEERPELWKRLDEGAGGGEQDEDAQALAQAYRDAAAEMMADPLFDLDSGHGMAPDDKWLGG